MWALILDGSLAFEASAFLPGLPALLQVPGGGRSSRVSSVWEDSVEPAFHLECEALEPH